MLVYWFFSKFKVNSRNFNGKTFEELEELRSSGDSINLLISRSWLNFKGKKYSWYRYYCQLDTGNLAFILYVEELIRAKGYDVRRFRDYLLIKNQSKIVEHSKREDVEELISSYLSEFVISRDIIPLLTKLTNDKKLKRRLELRISHDYNDPNSLMCSIDTTLENDSEHRDVILDLLESAEVNSKIPRNVFWLEVIKHYSEIITNTNYRNGFNAKIKLDEISNIIKAISKEEKVDYLVNLIHITGMPSLLSSSYYRSTGRRKEFITFIAKNKPSYLHPYLFNDDELDLALKHTSCLASIFDKNEFNLKLTNHGYKLSKEKREVYNTLLPTWQGSLAELEDAIQKL